VSGVDPLRSRFGPWLIYALLFALALGGAIAISLGLVAATGGSPLAALSAMFDGSLRSVSAVVTSIDRAVPLLLVAGGTAIAGNAGLVNVGQEGQVLIGALAGTAFGLKVAGSGAIGDVGILVASAVGGACWVGIAVLLKTRARVNETVSTLLLNYVAVQLVAFLVSRQSLLQAPPGSQPITPALRPSGELPSLASGVGFSLSSGIVVALLLAALAIVALRSTRFGFELRIFGMNPSCVESFGIRRQRIVATSLLISGAAAGLAGGVMLSLNPGGMTPTFSGGVGWEGLLVALVSGYNPIVVIPVAFGFGALDAGASFLVASGINATVAAVFEGAVALAVLVPRAMLDQMRQRTMTASLESFERAEKPTTPSTSSVGMQPGGIFTELATQSDAALGTDRGA